MVLGVSPVGKGADLQSLMTALGTSGSHGIAALLDADAYRALFEAVHDQMAAGLIVCEAPSGRFLYWNRQAEELAGHPMTQLEAPSEYLRLPAMHLDGRRYTIEEYPMSRALRGETVRDEHILYPRKDGSVARLSVSASPVIGADGHPAYGVCTFTDVTDTVRRDSELRQTQAELRLMAEWLPQLVWTTKADGTADWYNGRWYEFTGMPSDNGRALDKTPYDWTSYVHEDDRARAQEAWKKAVETGGVYEVEYRLLEGASGEYRWVLARGQPLRDGTGNIVRWFGTCTDIDDQVRSAERQRDLERALSRMLTATTVDEVMRIAIAEAMETLSANGVALNLYHEEDRTLRVAMADDGPSGRMTLQWGPISLDSELLAARAARTRESQFIVSTEDFAKTSEKAAIALKDLGVGSAAFCPMVAGDRLIGVMGFTFSRRGPFRSEQLRYIERLTNKTGQAIDRARLFEAASAARAEAERANKAKSAFLAVMSHELRSPLNAIDGHAALLEDGIHGAVNEAQVSAIQRLRRASRLLLTLITDLLDFARIEAGKVRYDIRDVRLRALVAEVGEVVEPLMAERGLIYETGKIPDVSIHADPDKARQILLNLITNAIKFSNIGGRIELSAECAGTARIRVRDNGIGIPHDRQEAIFDPFEQVDQTHRRQHQGVGLGLAISRDLARGMRGDLTVESSPGEGSTFTLALPLVP